jgi:RNA polymerase sigma-70 factor (ECF subfamily)
MEIPHRSHASIWDAVPAPAENSAIREAHPKLREAPNENGTVLLGSDEFGRAYERGFSRTIIFLRSRGLPADAATEFAQAAWVRAWERRSALRDNSVLQAWVNTIALNAFRSWLRDTQTHYRSEDTEPSYTPSLTTQHFARELLACAEGDARFLEHFYAWGLSAEQIAARHGSTPVAVRVRLCRARQRLRLLCSRRPRVRA